MVQLLQFLIMVSLTSTAAAAANRDTAAPSSKDPSVASDSSRSQSNEAPAAAGSESEPQAARLQNRLRSQFSINRAGMFVLGSWAIANIATGIAGHFLASGTRRAFHQMNAMWNTVNLAIAVAGYIGATGEPTRQGLAAYEQLLSAETIYLLNAGLDLGYMGAGAWMWERGLRVSSPTWRGFGQSVMLQGAFLLAFDLAMWGVQRHNRSQLDWRLAAAEIAPDVWAAVPTVAWQW